MGGTSQEGGSSSSSSNPPPPRPSFRRIPYLDDAAMSSRCPGLVTEALRQHGRVSDMHRVYAHALLLAKGVATMFGALREGLGIDPRLREMIMLFVGALNGAYYEYYHHYSSFLKEGGTAAEAEALADYEHSQLFDERDLSMLRYCHSMTRTLVVTDEVFAALKTHFDTKSIVEITCLCGGYNMISRIIHAVGLEAEEIFPGVESRPVMPRITVADPVVTGKAVSFPRVPHLDDDYLSHFPDTMEGAKHREGRLLNLHRVLQHAPVVAEGIYALFGILRQRLTIDGRLRELIILQVGVENRAYYEYFQHFHYFLREGGTREEAASLGDWEGSGSFNERDLSVLRYCHSMTRHLVVKDEVYHAMAAHFNTEQILEITTLCAAYNMVARILLAIQIQPEEDLPGENRPVMPETTM